MIRCAVWYHLYNLKNVKNTHGGVLILVKLQGSATRHICLRGSLLRLCIPNDQRIVLLNFASPWKRCEIFFIVFWSSSYLTSFSFTSIRMPLRDTEQHNTFSKCMNYPTLTHYNPVLFFCTPWKHFGGYRKATPGCDGLQCKNFCYIEGSESSQFQN